MGETILKELQESIEKIRQYLQRLDRSIYTAREQSLLKDVVRHQVRKLAVIYNLRSADFGLLEIDELAEFREKLRSDGIEESSLTALIEAAIKGLAVHSDEANQSSTKVGHLS